MSPHGSYISNTHGKNIEFRPVKSLNIEQHTSEQRELREEVGRVFYHEVEGATLELPVDEFLLQLRVAVPELTTMLNFLVTGDITVFENSDSTDNLLLSLYAQLEETGLL